MTTDEDESHRAIRKTDPGIGKDAITLAYEQELDAWERTRVAGGWQIADRVCGNRPVHPSLLLEEAARQWRESCVAIGEVATLALFGPMPTPERYPGHDKIAVHRAETKAHPVPRLVPPGTQRLSEAPVRWPEVTAKKVPAVQESTSTTLKLGDRDAKAAASAAVDAAAAVSDEVEAAFADFEGVSTATPLPMLLPDEKMVAVLMDEARDASTELGPGEDRWSLPAVAGSRPPIAVPLEQSYLAPPSSMEAAVTGFDAASAADFFRDKLANDPHQPNTPVEVEAQTLEPTMVERAAPPPQEPVVAERARTLDPAISDTPSHGVSRVAPVTQPFIRRTSSFGKHAIAVLVAACGLLVVSAVLFGKFRNQTPRPVTIAASIQTPTVPRTVPTPGTRQLAAPRPVAAPVVTQPVTVPTEPTCITQTTWELLDHDERHRYDFGCRMGTRDHARFICLYPRIYGRSAGAIQRKNEICGAITQACVRSSPDGRHALFNEACLGRQPPTPPPPPAP